MKDTESKHRWHQSSQRSGPLKSVVVSEIDLLLQRNMSLELSDFDGLVRQFLHAIYGAGGKVSLQDALDAVHESTKYKPREVVGNWSAYINKHLKSFFRDLTQKTKDSAEASELPGDTDHMTQLNPEAPIFVPGAMVHLLHKELQLMQTMPLSHGVAPIPGSCASMRPLPCFVDAKAMVCVPSRVEWLLCGPFLPPLCPPPHVLFNVSGSLAAPTRDAENFVSGLSQQRPSEASTSLSAALSYKVPQESMDVWEISSEASSISLVQSSRCGWEIVDGNVLAHSSVAGSIAKSSQDYDSDEEDLVVLSTTNESDPVDILSGDDDFVLV